MKNSAFSDYDLANAMAKAKIGLMTKPESVFWSTVCMGLKHSYNDNISTARTDGLNVEYSPDFFMNGCKNNEERTGLVFHELGHVVFQHVQRRGSRDPKLYNIAGDHVINITGNDVGFIFPDKPYMDFKYRGWSTEQIYDDLVLNPPPDLPDFECDLVPSESGDGDTPEEIQGKIDDLLVKGVMAAEQADQAGNIPADIRRHVNNLINPIIPWDNILRRFMTQFDQTRYNYKTPNRRFFPGTFLPKKKSKALGRIAFAIDASASVSDKEFEAYVAGIQRVLKHYKPKAIDLIQFTTKINDCREVKSVHELLNIDFAGKGGTSVVPVIKWAAENKPALLIIFSDGQFNRPSDNPGIPVVWIIHDNKKFTVPFGKVIHFDIPS